MVLAAVQHERNRVHRVLLRKAKHNWIKKGKI
jgi:hypothetical protein